MLYLYLIRYLNENSILDYKTGTDGHHSVGYHSLAHETRDKRKGVAAELQLYSDQGFQNTYQTYFNLTKQYGIKTSISKHRNCYDNAMQENFFSILKQSVSAVTSQLVSMKQRV